MQRFEVHAHTDYSNIRILDCINKYDKLINKALDQGLSGIAITDHEILTGAAEANKYAQSLYKEHPDFKVAIGNEIYLCPDRSMGQKYYHFILIAKNQTGYRALKELSSRAWLQSYYDRRYERVPTTYQELEEIVHKFPNSLIATTACFRKGTKVATKEGFKEIENISVNDFILNQYGQWEKINFPTRRQYYGVGKEILFLENPTPTICTEDHQFLVTTNNKIKSYRTYGKNPLEWVEAKNLNTSKGSQKHICLYPIPAIQYKHDDIVIKKAEWKHCLRQDDYFTKKPIKENILITPEVMRLFGLWLGDGYISINQDTNKYSIGFTFNNEEFEYYWNSFVQKASQDIGVEWSINERLEHHRIDLSSSSLELTELFYYLFGLNHANTKYVPERLKHLTQELDFNLFFGYALADGYFRTRQKDGYDYGEMTVASISNQLIFDMQEILKSCNIRSSITEKQEKTDKNKTHHQKSYYLSSSNKAWTLVNKTELISNDRVQSIMEIAIQHNAKNYIEIEGVLYKKVYIKSIKDLQLNEEVYCLNVDSHSFVCNGVIVHNCLGGELSVQTMNLISAESVFDAASASAANHRITEFVLWCKELFGDDFYIECAPGCSADQIAVNKRLVSIANCFNVKMVIGTDAHYLNKEDRYVHKAYLQSKEGEREVDAFYEYSYLQNENEIREHLAQSIPDEVDKMFSNSIEIYNKIENYSIFHKQSIPNVEIEDYPSSAWWGVNNDYADEMAQFPIIKSMFTSKDKAERNWINQCWNALKDKGIDLFGDAESSVKAEKYLKRLEEEADIKRAVGEALETNIFMYPLVLQHYIDLFWEAGSTVGAGRGSACAGLNHYLLGITQLDPIEWDLQFWRYLNKDRLDELPDIDIDICPSKRPKILREIKKERSSSFYDNVDEISRNNLGCTLVATFATETTKSTILTACRGYRSEEYPDGIDNDTAQYISSLIPSERGFIYSLEDVVYGNKDKGRKPNQTFLNEVNKYPRLLEIMFGIQNLIKQRGSHASGVVMFDGDPYEFGCFMKTPKGEIITQYDLHLDEYCGMTKYDFLVTDVQDKITEAIRLLQEYDEIDSNLSLREVYNKYLHPSVLPIEDQSVWEHLQNNDIINIFQFDSAVGSQAAKKIRPTNMLELCDANGLMRLMTAEKGEESPMEKYIRFKDDISLWYDEMDRAGLTKEEEKTLEPYFLPSYGVPPSQEQLMTMLMDENICGFSLKEANNARKIVGKKKMSEIPALKKTVIERAKSSQLGQYVWTYGAGPQMGYSFNRTHSLSYSFIGFQTMYLGSHWNPIYWDTACLIVNSGSLEEEDDEEVDIKQKNKGADYAKMARALGDIIGHGVKVSLVDTNKSSFGFEPDAANNQILFGMKALSSINTEVIENILSKRPFVSFTDFMTRCPLNKKQMISLIKAGAFDKLEEKWANQLGVEPRMLVMVEYLIKASKPKTKLTLQNFNELITKDLIPLSLEPQKQIFLFNKHLKSDCKKGMYYILNQGELDFYLNECDYDPDNINIIQGCSCILQKTWDKLYQIEMNEARDWLKENQADVLKELNTIAFLEQWNKYAQGSISAWEMESCCFYYHEHELVDVNVRKYGIDDFFKLPQAPVVESFYKRNGHRNPIFVLNKIIGTVLCKNDTKSTVSILTTTGVVDVKFTKEYYAMFNRQIAEKLPNGKKHICETGWFTRGTKIMVTGFRRDDTFVAKSYSKTPTHQLYKITYVDDDGNMILVHDRYGQEGDRDE